MCNVQIRRFLVGLFLALAFGGQAYAQSPESRKPDGCEKLAFKPQPTGAADRELLARAEQRSEALWAKMFEVQMQEIELQTRLDDLDYRLTPDGLRRALALAGRLQAGMPWPGARACFSLASDRQRRYYDRILGLATRIDNLNLPEVVMSKTVRDIIKDRKEVYCISNQMTVAEAARFLKERAIRATGICNLSGKIVGVVSQSDISDKVVAENYRPSEVSVQSIASSNLIKVTSETDIDAALQVLQQKGVYHLIVEDADGKFLGMVSMRDCVAMKGEEEKERAEMLKDYAFPSY